MPVSETLQRARCRWYQAQVAWWAQRKGEVTLHQPIFMVGCPRSGTTIAGQLFGAHPRLADLSEAGVLWDPARYFDPLADHEWPVDRADPAERQRMHRSFEYHRARLGRERFFNKHPRNSVRIEYIDRLFPDAFFVHVIRDGRATALSIVSSVEQQCRRQGIPFGNFCKPPAWRELLRDDPVEQAALQWREIVAYVLARRPLLADRYVELRYEHLCDDTRGALAESYTACGLSVTPEDLAHVPTTLPSRNDKWRGAWMPAQIEMVQAIEGPLLTDLGYR